MKGKKNKQFRNVKGKKNTTKTEPNQVLEIPKICLCMIVKNESKIILRCLESAKSIIDYISICDTGSTDNTMELIEEWGKKNSIPCKVHLEQFKNFGYNRTLSVELGQKTYPDSTYFLLLDADMILIVNSDFSKSALTKDKYSIQQFDAYIKYWNVRLVKNTLSWKCIGVTHEYWDGDREHTSDCCYTLQIDDREDGGCKSDKFERDKKLLMEGLKDKTISVGLRSRYMFYLAQTLKDLGEYEEAIQWYTKRIKSKDNFPEESFYAQYRIGTCYELWSKKLENQLHYDIAKKDTLAKINDPQYTRTKPCKICSKMEYHHTEDPIENIEKDLLSKDKFKELLKRKNELFLLSISSHLKSWQMRPHRSEPLYDISRIYREKGNNDLSLIFALKGKEIPYPKQDLLFIDFRVYEYLFDYEISIVAFYNPSTREIGRNSFKKLMRIKDKLPENIRNIMQNNSKFYRDQ